MLPLTPDELLTTTRTVRKRLDFDRPVPRSMIEECIEIACQAPSGGMKQNWHWIVIGDEETKKKIGEIYRDSWMTNAAAGNVPSYEADNPRSARMARVVESATYLAENMGRAPWLVIPCGTGRVMESPTVPEQSRFWSSVLPAMWNFMLAARARGLGVAWTSEALKREEEIADLLGIPYPEVTQCGLFPVAYSIGTDFKKASRIPGSELTHWDRW
ncbi:nitroreductase family protein [Dactylosporangium sp. NPDC051484]|uniref:nitroreductase family protein n=1 Tax=Dactylosporangium sp. NPDC051484 TaxID=3154942 RepID=UPI00344B8526